MARIVVIALLLTSALQSTVSAQDGPSKDVPELEILSKYLGTWDIAISATERTSATKGEATAKWILDGMYLERSGFLSDGLGEPYIKIRELMTYDKRQQSYRMWTFDSTGMAQESAGKWDSATNTLTWVRDREGFTATTAVTFESESVAKWAMSSTKAGVVRAGVSGANKRREKEADKDR